MEKIKYLHQYDILDLQDNNLQLRYFLGGFNSDEKKMCDKFWWCDVECSCSPVPDDERLNKVKEFINKHNISNETFMRLLISRNFNGYFKSYNGDFGEFINELDEIIKEYNIHKFPRHNGSDDYKNGLSEQQLIEYVNRESLIDDSLLNKFLSYYQLSLLDFIVLAKTRKFIVIRDRERYDLLIDLSILLREYELKLKHCKLVNMKDEVVKTKKLSIFKK